MFVTHEGRWNGLTEADTYSRKIAEMTKCTPNDVSSSVKSELPRTREKATRSIANEVSTALSTISGVTMYHDHSRPSVHSAT